MNQAYGSTIPIRDSSRRLLHWFRRTLIVCRCLCIAALIGYASFGAFRGMAELAATNAIILPPAATRQVNFAKDIQPILAHNCVECHGPEKQKGGLRLDQKAA